MKKLLILLLLMGAGLIGAAYWLSLPKSTANGDDGFKFEAVERGDIAESVSATGPLVPVESIVVGTDLPGKVVQLFPNAEFNKEVVEGEPLLQLDDMVARQAVEEAQAAVAAAEAGLAAAQADLAKAHAGQFAAQLNVDRLTRLVKENIGMQKELDVALIQLKQAEAGITAAQAGIKAAEGRIEQAKAARSKAQTGVDLSTVRVPIRHETTGEKRKYTILERQVTRGQLIGPQMPTPLFTLASDLGEMQVYAQVAEGDVTKIKPGLEASFTIYGYADGRRFDAQVVQIRPKPTNVQGAVFFTVVLDVKNSRDENTKEWRLRPGMTANVDIHLRTHKDVWKVPTKALSFQLEKEYQSEAGKKKLETWMKDRRDAEDWKPVWILDEHKKGYPIYVRTGGRRAQGETALKDGQFNEVLEWDPELKPPPVPGKPETYPQFLVDAPPVQKSGLFSKQIKLF